MRKYVRLIAGNALVLFIALALPSLIHGQEFTTNSATFVTRVAPGEALPLAVKLANFGSNELVDVTIYYEIVDIAENVVASQSETVAVQTTAGFVKQIPLSQSIKPGQYTARVYIVYDSQRVPTTTTQQFTVERKVLGIFLSDLITYVSFLIIAILLVLLFVVFFIRYRRQASFRPYDYSHVPDNARVYYEIISDAIQQMRLHKGDVAIKIAADIPGMTVDQKNGRVLTITRDPAEVIAAIVLQYEKKLGKKVNLSFAGGDKSRAIIR